MGDQTEELDIGGEGNRDDVGATELPEIARGRERYGQRRAESGLDCGGNRCELCRRDTYAIHESQCHIQTRYLEHTRCPLEVDSIETIPVQQVSLTPQESIRNMTN